jgi:pSer/pThr/pTyr-binding forkhead associated (FHA) protein
MPKLTLSFKSQVLSTHHLEEGLTTLGRAPDCDIHIDSLAVAPRHLALRAHAGECHLQSLDPDSPVFVNDQPVTSARLSHGDILRVGKHTLAYAADAISLTSPGSEPTAARPGGEPAHHPAYVQILSGQHMGRIIPLSRSMVRLGKAGADCAMIVQRDDGHHLSHLEGNVPTVDGKPIDAAGVLLTAGCRIHIGDTELQFFP